jgi:amino acid transporter
VVSTIGPLSSPLPSGLRCVLPSSLLVLHCARPVLTASRLSLGSLVATAGSLAGSLITGVIALLHDDYNVERWHIFLVYLAYMLGACFINIFGLRTLPTINKTAIFW